MKEEFSTFGARLAEERRRLRLNQEELAVIAGSTKRSIGNYERGESSPDAELLLKLSQAGVDIYYALMGQRATASLDLNPMQRSVLDDFNRCSPEKQLEAVKYMALLAEGVKPSASGAPARKKKAR